MRKQISCGLCVAGLFSKVFREGELTKSLSIAHNFLLMGMSLEQATGLTKEQLTEMKKN